MSDDKARAAFDAHASGSPGTTNWDDLSETVKAAWRAAVETTRANDPKLVNLNATGTHGSMLGTDPNVNPHQARPSEPTATPATFPSAAPPAAREDKKK